MSSKDKEKENKAFQQSMKQFFKQLNKGNIGNLKATPEFILTEEIQKDLLPDAPLATRTKTIHSLCDIVESKRLEDHAVEKFWVWLKDLMTRDQPAEVRQLAFMFFTCLVKGQGQTLNLMRAHFFRVIKEYDHPEDIIQRFQLLQALTENGKDILTFEEEVGLFLLSWMQDIVHAGGTVEYLKLLVNVIKYNAAYIDEYVINKLVEHLCVLCCNSNDPEVINACLHVLETIVAYSNLPRESLVHFIAALCRTVNGRQYCLFSWKIMRNLLGTHMGHRTLFTMCRLLEDPVVKDNTCLLRGAVFFIHQGLWGKNPLPNLKCPLTAVVPAILTCAEYQHITVSYEIILGMQNLIERRYNEMHGAAWNSVCKVMKVIIKQIEAAPTQVPNPIVAEILHKTLDKIEDLITEENFRGSLQQFYDLIELCAKSRPENSILRLTSYLSQGIIVTNYMWLTNLHSLLNKYFKNEARTTIRLKVVDILNRKVNLHRKQYEDELLDRIVIPYTINIAQDNDVAVRSAVANLLVDLSLGCISRRCWEMLDILEKLLNRPFDHYNPEGPNDTDFSDVDIVVAGLLKIFRKKIHVLPSSHAVKVYKMLVNHLNLHYSKPKVSEPLGEVRYTIFDSFLKMRADEHYHLGYPDCLNRIWYSSYLCVAHKNSDVASPPPPSPLPSQQHPVIITYISMRYSFKVVVNCLKHEKDWLTLNLVLQEIPKVLQNKTLILTKTGNNEIDYLVDALCALTTDKARISPENLNQTVNKLEFHSVVLVALSALASYHCFINTGHQQKMIRCLYKYGFGPRQTQQSITALTTCTLEMKDVMVKVLPETLLTLSKVSATPYIAIPILEFLSMLTQLPTVFSNFVADQYMAVFAISLPYTNPFRYNHYTVSLAHHVIAVWFLKCRLPFRKDFVRFITNGLQTNVLVPFQETRFLSSDLSKLNQDSSDRKRSSSLTEQSSRRRAATVGRLDGKPFDFHRKPVGDTNTVMFYEELTETCLDLMARYAFAPCSAVPKRTPLADFLLNGGQSMTWLLDNRLVTITTSGCSQKPTKNGVCDQCWTMCKLENMVTTQRSSRSGSNEKDESSSGSNRASRQNSDEKGTSTPVEGIAEALEGKSEKVLCACWCQGWAEVYIRRPTGDSSFMTRIQNQLSFQQHEFPLNELSSLILPKLHQEDTDVVVGVESGLPPQNLLVEEYSSWSVPINIPASPSRQTSRDSADESEDVEYDDGTTSRNPVRRSNSSPEMSANWKNPFLMQKQQSEDGRNDDDCGKKVKNYSKDMRVSCEAIPEEIAGAGTTPPAASQMLRKVPDTQQHPTLLSCHSYPGSHQPPEPTIPAKANRTVPPSPNVLQTTAQQGLTFSTARNPNVVGLLRTTRSESTESDKGVLSNLAPLTSKPPQSPTQTSPRLPRHASFRDGHDVQKSSSLILEKTRDKSKDKLNQADANQKRDRGYTISVMSPARKPRTEPPRQQPTARAKETPKSGLHPSFVFLHLYHTGCFVLPKDKPLLVDSSQVVQRAVKVLDCIQPYETHKIGVIFIGEGQCNKETEILRNTYGSKRYQDFLSTLGQLVKLEDANPPHFFLGGLEQNGADGKFTYIWQDDVVKVAFHIATMMPNKESDLNCNNKKMHIGNNNVTIVYNESEEDYNINTLKGQFNFASVIIHPLDHNTNRVVVKGKDELMEMIGHNEPKIVSDQNVALLVRQLALHADLASMVLSSLKRSVDPYASNWLERLRKIKNVKSKILQEENNKEQQEGHIVDFTDYT